MEKKIEKIVVTRHPALVEYLLELGLVDKNVKVLDHAIESDVKGKHVFGVIPHSLSCLAKLFTVVSLFLPANLRGVELDLEQVKKYAIGIRTYTMSEIKK